RIQALLSAREIVLTVVGSGREIQFRVDRESWIFARRWSINVCVVAVISRVSPHVVILRFEALYERRIVGKVNRFVKIVDVWRIGNKEITGIVRPAEFQLVLTYKQHQLPMENAVCKFVAHGDTGIA